MNSIKPADKIASNNAYFLKNKLKLEVSEINKKLFNIYWTQNSNVYDRWT